MTGEAAIAFSLFLGLCFLLGLISAERHITRIETAMRRLDEAERHRAQSSDTGGSQHGRKPSMKRIETRGSHLYD